MNAVLTWAAIVGLHLIVVASVSKAHGLTLLGPSMAVENVHVEPANAGDDSLLRFAIRNDAREKLVLLSIKASSTRSIRMMARVGLHSWTKLDSVMIPGDSILDFGPPNFKIVIEGTGVDLVEGGALPVDLIFSRGVISVSAHVTKP